VDDAPVKVVDLACGEQLPEEIFTESSARRKSANTATVSWHSSSGTDRSR